MVPIAVRNGIRGGWGANFQNGKNAMEKEKNETKMEKMQQKWKKMEQNLSVIIFRKISWYE